MPCTDGGVPYSLPAQREIAEKDFLKNWSVNAVFGVSSGLDRLGYDFDKNPHIWNGGQSTKAEDARLEREELERQRKNFEKRIIKDALQVSG